MRTSDRVTSSDSCSVGDQRLEPEDPDVSEGQGVVEERGASIPLGETINQANHTKPNMVQTGKQNGKDA